MEDKYNSVKLSNLEIEIILRALDVFNIDMNNAATVCGDPESLEDAEISAHLMDELESYLKESATEVNDEE